MLMTQRKDVCFNVHFTQGYMAIMQPTSVSVYALILLLETTIPEFAMMYVSLGLTWDLILLLSTLMLTLLLSFVYKNALDTIMLTIGQSLAHSIALWEHLQIILHGDVLQFAL